MNASSNRRRMLSGASLVILGILFVTNPVTRLMYRGGDASQMLIALRGLLAPVHMALMVGAVVGITQLLRERADRAGLIGGALTLMGWGAGIRILAIGQLESLSHDAVRPLLSTSTPIFLSLVANGILFPIGVITLGVTLAIARPIPRIFGVLLAIGGVLFPMGRIPGEPWALVACDLILGSALVMIGLTYWRVAYPAARQNEAVS